MCVAAAGASFDEHDFSTRLRDAVNLRCQSALSHGRRCRTDTAGACYHGNLHTPVTWTVPLNKIMRKLKFDLFLADRTNGRAIATLLCLSSVVVVVVCDVMYCG